MPSYSPGQSRGSEPSRPESAARSDEHRHRAASLTFYLSLPLILALLLLVVPGGSLWAQERSAEPLPSPMSGIEVSEQQRAAMRASWALVAGEWEAVLARSREAGTVSAEDSRTLARLASEHNERLLGIFTPAQRERLEVNLEELRRESERRGEARPAAVPAVPGGESPPRMNDRGMMEAGEEVHS